jgi:hypothetical protein
LPQLHLRSSAFICGKKILLPYFLEVFWRFAQTTGAKVTVRVAACLLAVTLCTHLA